jgi:hypothetical protein
VAVTDWITLHQAAARLADKHPLPGTAHELTENAVKSGKLRVRGRRWDMAWWKSSYEVIPAHLLASARVDVILNRIDHRTEVSWTDVQVRWKKFIIYVEQNLLPDWIDGLRTTEERPTRQEAVRAYLDQKYQGHIPAGVTNKEIARAVGVSDRTVRRARGLK